MWDTINGPAQNAARDRALLQTIHPMRDTLRILQTKTAADCRLTNIEAALGEWAVSDDTTLCRQQKMFAVQISYRRAEGPLRLLVDSTGISFLGDGELQAREHGVQGRSQWRKVHLATGMATADIRAVEFASSSDADRPVLLELLDHVPETKVIGTATAPRQQTASMTPAAATPPRAAQLRLAKRNPSRHPTLWQGVLKALDQIQHPKPY